MDAPILATDVVSGANHRAGGGVIVFAHGILGNKSNWKGFARRLCERQPTLSCVLVDLRRHGESHGAGYVDADDTVAAAAADVSRTLAHLGVTATVAVGHSWGGKAMLALGLDAPAGLANVVVVDSPPGTRTFHGGAGEELERVVEIISSLPPGLATDRRHLVEQLTGRGLSTAIAQWMTTNLVALPEPEPSGLGFRFKFDLPGVRRMLADFGALDLWPRVLAHRPPPHIHMVRGGRSDRWRDDERARLAEAVAAGVVTDTVLQRAGHWVHTDDPDGLLDVIEPLCVG